MPKDLHPVSILDHNNRVRLPRSIWLATLCALLVATFAPRADAVWQCEGRACGSTPWFCCCVSPAEFRDAHCQPSGEPSPGAGLCSSACACVLTIRALGGTPMVAPRYSAPDFHPAMLSSLPIPTVPLPVEMPP